MSTPFRWPPEWPEPPLVSVVLTTRDRPRFLTVALRCYAHQTYPNRELIVVDDGDQFPADSAAIAAVGGRMLHAEPGTPIGTKLNLGLAAARGLLCQKMDDDDWYAPAYTATVARAIVARWRVTCRPTTALVTPFLFFDVAAWEVRRSIDGNVPGATLVFRRQDWAEAPFRNLPGDEDLWFYQDQLKLGATAVMVKAPDLFLAVRHRGARHDRGHTWVHQSNTVALEQYLTERPLHKTPEALLPPWALDFYRGLRDELREAQPAS